MARDRKLFPRKAMDRIGLEKSPRPAIIASPKSPAARTADQRFDRLTGLKAAMGTHWKRRPARHHSAPPTRFGGDGHGAALPLQCSKNTEEICIAPAFAASPNAQNS